VIRAKVRRESYRWLEGAYCSESIYASLRCNRLLWLDKRVVLFLFYCLHQRALRLASVLLFDVAVTIAVAVTSLARVASTLPPDWFSVRGSARLALFRFLDFDSHGSAEQPFVGVTE
jgi:hypothetical protein